MTVTCWFLKSDRRKESVNNFQLMVIAFQYRLTETEGKQTASNSIHLLERKRRIPFVISGPGGDEVAEDGWGLEGLDLNSGWNWQSRKKG
jgi:hypothetical protein